MNTSEQLLLPLDLPPVRQQDCEIVIVDQSAGEAMCLTHGASFKFSEHPDGCPRCNKQNNG